MNKKMRKLNFTFKLTLSKYDNRGGKIIFVCLAARKDQD
jgi:hypothetical protein